MAVPKRRFLLIFAGIAGLVIGLGLISLWVMASVAESRFQTLKSRIRQAGGDVEGITAAERDSSAKNGLIPREKLNFLFGFDGYEVEVRDRNASSEQLRELFATRPIQKLKAPHAKNLDDDWMARIPEPQTMRFMDLTGTAITDRSVEVMLKMSGLTGLYCLETNLSDSAVAQFIQLPLLQSVFVSGPNLHSVKLVKLEYLDGTGQPAKKADVPLFAVGELSDDGLVGTPELMSITINALPDLSEGGPPVDHAKDGYAVADLVASTPGHYRFKAKLETFPTGESRVLLSVRHKPKADPLQVWYQLDAPVVKLEPPTPSDSSPAPDRD